MKKSKVRPAEVWQGEALLDASEFPRWSDLRRSDRPASCFLECQPSVNITDWLRGGYRTQRPPPRGSRPPGHMVMLGGGECEQAVILSVD